MKYTGQNDHTTHAKHADRYLVLKDYRKGLFHSGVCIREETLTEAPKGLASIKLEEAEVSALAGREAKPYFNCKKEKKMYRSLDVPGDPFEIESSCSDILTKSGQFNLEEGALVRFGGSLSFRETFQPLERFGGNRKISTHITVESGGVLEVEGDVELGKKVTVRVNAGGRLIMRAGASVAAGAAVEVARGETRVLG
jgi:hypothetical protein